MKKFLLTLLVTLILLLAFVLYTFISTGYFREINNTESYEVIAEIPLKGAEDLTISYADRFVIISQDDRAGRRDGSSSQGGLHYLNLDSGDFQPKLISDNYNFPFYPHGISMLKLDSAHYQLLVVNHAKQHSIVKFELFGDSLVYMATYRDPSMISPNDVVALDEETFYFTNDHGYSSKWGRLAEDYLGIGVSNVVLYDGQYQVVADGINYANGINISQDRSQLLVASPRAFQLHYYNILEDRSLEHDRDLDVGSGIDNIELDENGDLWMGSHPSLLTFAAYAAGKKETAPSEVIKVSNGEVVESLYENDGSTMSASSVVAPYNDLLFVGTVMDDELVVLKKRDK
ncbi:SMP-30/gluconolactonase/LRE family protein [Ekhidna sp. To15]|uniref:SMP-30/gluconolactonase/LRE family protein n=1 Tax=Ekhidna sp. To15 TaxID=3395267 RepID=UPI003F5226B3